jgi:rhodanese-related sulfurtransferase
VAKFAAAVASAPAEGDWQVKSDDLAAWIKEGKKDFLVVDVRPAPPAGPGQQGGKIPGSIYIPYNEIFKPENLARLPKDKKLVLACVTGQTQNIPVLALRVLGYDARTLKFGFGGWIPGYFGGQFMQNALQNAATKNYPVEK